MIGPTIDARVGNIFKMIVNCGGRTSHRMNLRAETAPSGIDGLTDQHEVQSLGRITNPTCDCPGSRPWTRKLSFYNKSTRCFRYRNHCLMAPPKPNDGASDGEAPAPTGEVAPKWKTTGLQQANSMGGGGAAAIPKNGKFRVFVLMGQSNMTGAARAKELKPPYNQKHDRIRIWANGRWEHFVPCVRRWWHGGRD